MAAVSGGQSDGTASGRMAETTIGDNEGEEGIVTAEDAVHAPF
jgi:hypothetical protein